MDKFRNDIVAREQMMDYWDEEYACARLGLTKDGTGRHEITNCPGFGSSDCPITMRLAEGPECDACRSDRARKMLEHVMSFCPYPA